MKKPQYPLTDEAKDLACWLVKKWDENQEFQTFFVLTYSKSKYVIIFNDENIDIKAPALKELIRLNLVDREQKVSGNLDITLLQELRIAVANNFMMPDEHSPQITNNKDADKQNKLQTVAAIATIIGVIATIILGFLQFG